MSYYTDLDNDIGAESEVAENMREDEWSRRREATSKKREIRNEVKRQLVNAGVTSEPLKPRGAMVDVDCSCCGREFAARVADRKRGWGKYCSKSCKAKRQRD